MGITDKIFKIKDNNEFNDIALQIFHFQATNVSVYKEYIQLLNINSNNITSIYDIPFLPIQFFKSKNIISNNDVSQKIFKSSSTTGQNRSSHLLKDIELYNKSFLTSFNAFYGDIEDYIILALLPSYLEQGDSSLIYMVDKLIKLSNNKQSSFVTKEKIIKKSIEINKQKKVILIGVSYALLELTNEIDLDLSSWIVMETGGMKGRGKEVTRDELHLQLSKGLNLKKIHSEYSMTELLSQAYSKGDGIFYCPSWMKVVIREFDDPLSVCGFKKTGGVNIIDLANYYSCSFIATQDLGRYYEDASFEILGRFDNSNVRGCNLLV